MNNISFKQRVCQSIIDQSKIYKKIFIDRQYLICSKCFTNRKYYILVANKDNYLHLVGVHTTLTPSEFFEKCFNDTLTENDFDFSKKNQSEKSVKGSVRRKIAALENINNFFAQDLYIEEGFRKNKVSCVIVVWLFVRNYLLMLSKRVKDNHDLLRLCKLFFETLLLACF